MTHALQVFGSYLAFGGAMFLLGVIVGGAFALREHERRHAFRELMIRRYLPQPQGRGRP